MTDWSDALAAIERSCKGPSWARVSSLQHLVLLFEADPDVRRILDAPGADRKRAAHRIHGELRSRGPGLIEVHRTCLAWMLDRLDPVLARKTVLPLLARSLIRPSEYFTITAALIVLKDRMSVDVLRQLSSPQLLLHAARAVPPQIMIEARAAGPLDDEYAKLHVFGIRTRYGTELDYIYLRWRINGEDEAWREQSRHTWDRYGRMFDAQYRHLSGAVAALGPAARYNCHGFTFLPRRYTMGGGQYFTDPLPVDRVLRDNCVTVPRAWVRPGDIIRYVKRVQVGVTPGGGPIFLPIAYTMHTGRVWEVATSMQEYRIGCGWTPGTGHTSDLVAFDKVTLVRSKLDTNAQEAIHSPYQQQVIDDYAPYGEIEYFRQFFPLRGNTADVWIKTHLDDIGEQYCVSAFWQSPDIKIAEAPPLGGARWDPERATLVTSPLIIGKRYRIWAKVRNRGDLDLLNNVMIRYFWSYSGCAQWRDWVPIDPGRIPGPGPSLPSLRYAVGPFSMPGRAGVEPSNADPWPLQPLKPAVNAPYVDWTPPAQLPGTQGCHLCFLAVVTPVHPADNPPGDDPTNRYNPDPIVYPWEPAWDNNIAMLNTSTVPAQPGQLVKQSLILGRPEKGETLEGQIEAVLSQACEPERLGFVRETLPLDFLLACDGVNQASTGFEDYVGKGVWFMPDDPHGLEAPLGGAVLPYKIEGGGARRLVDVLVKVPREAKRGSVYYLRVAQNNYGRVLSGCTLIIKVG